jgi:excisionase family DNA binding protein
MRGFASERLGLDFFKPIAEVMATQTTPLLMGKPSAARLLGVSEGCLERIIQRGSLEVVHLAPGLHPRVRRADVEALARGEGPAAKTRP